MPLLRQTPLYDRALGCLLGGLIGDAMGTPTEGKRYADIAATLGWVDDFTGDGTDDTVMKNLLAQALINTDGYATLDDWAAVWLANWQAIFGDKVNKFFISVLNTAQKLRHGVAPRLAALGNLPSSSSAMCIAPVGIVNAGNPRLAALQARDLGSLIHTYDAAYCQDGAAAIAAAVAAAFVPGATVESVLAAALAAILPSSGAELRRRCELALALVETASAASRPHQAYCQAVYARSDELFSAIMCDSRETIPLTLGLFRLAGGDMARCVTYATNLGRDADTTATMAGAIAGALGGARAIREDWRAKAIRLTRTDQLALAEALARTALRKREREKAALATLDTLIVPSDHTPKEGKA